jgi:hypothetical protein
VLVVGSLPVVVSEEDTTLEAVVVMVNVELPLDSCDSEDEVLPVLLGLAGASGLGPSPVSDEDEAVVVAIISVGLLAIDCVLWEVVLDMAVVPLDDREDDLLAPSGSVDMDLPKHSDRLGHTQPPVKVTTQ